MDRIFVSGYVPHLQHEGGVVRFLIEAGPSPNRRQVTRAAKGAAGQITGVAGLGYPDGGATSSSWMLSGSRNTSTDP